MSNFFDTLTRHPETLKNAAGGALSDLGGMGRSVMMLWAKTIWAACWAPGPWAA